MIDQVYMGIVYDSLRILNIHSDSFFINIKPVCGYSGIIHGEVFTTYGEVVVDYKVPYFELDNIRLEIYKKELFTNNPIVFLQANDSKVAHSGDITSMIYQKLGAFGFVTDGNVRDADLIDKLGFPVFCRDTNPIDALEYWALTKYQVDITIDGVRISPGDYAFASKDGVIIVPGAIRKDFSRIMMKQLDRENSIRDAIRKNNDLTQVLKEFGRW